LRSCLFLLGPLPACRNPVARLCAFPSKYCKTMESLLSTSSFSTLP
jgi:hypothetical protein